MAELKVISELGLNETLVVIEPARKCVAKCTYCYVILNRSSQYQGKRPDDSDPGTFEARVEAAFGPRYDPTDFEEWWLRNRFPVVYASTVEPFGDVPQAKGILSVLKALKIPVLFQAKGVNWREVWDSILPLAGNAGFYVSFPTPDDEVLRKFEPGTPPAAERAALIEAACKADFPVMLAVAPFCPEWCDDLPGHVASMLELGVESVFLDSLHLSSKQAATLATSKQRYAPETIEAAKTSFGQPFIDVAAEVRDLCVMAGAGFEAAEPSLPRYGIDPVRAIAPQSYRHGRRWPYCDDAYLGAANRQFGDEAGPPILIRWADALACMESSVDPRDFDQPFSWASMRRWLYPLKKLAPAWQRTLQPAAPMREYLRAMWNEPMGGPGWRHPFTRVAMRPDGQPWRDGAGNVCMVFDPHWPARSQKREIADLSGCRQLEWG